MAVSGEAEHCAAPSGPDRALRPWVLAPSLPRRPVGYSRRALGASPSPPFLSVPLRGSAFSGPAASCLLLSVTREGQRVAVSRAELSLSVRGPAGSTPSPERFSRCSRGKVGPWRRVAGPLARFVHSPARGWWRLGRAPQLPLARPASAHRAHISSSSHPWTPSFPGSLASPFGVHHPVSPGPSAGLLVHPRKV